MNRVHGPVRLCSACRDNPLEPRSTRLTCGAVDGSRKMRRRAQEQLAGSGILAAAKSRKAAAAIAACGPGIPMKMKEAAIRGGLTSLQIRRSFDVRRPGTGIGRRDNSFEMGLKIDRLCDQGSYNLGIFGGLGDLEKRRRLTREVGSAEHCTFPKIHNRSTTRANLSFVPKKSIKVHLRELFGPGSPYNGKWGVICPASSQLRPIFSPRHPARPIARSRECRSARSR